VGTVAFEILLDADLNPYNGNEIAVDQELLARTGKGVISIATLSPATDAAIVPPGAYWVCARVNDGARTRYLYAPQRLIVTPSLQAPSVDVGSLALSGGVLRFNAHGFPGQQVTVMVSDDLVNWLPLQTHTFTGTIWEFMDADAGKFAKRFYRAALAP
jgi:hypothetical protein